MNIDEMSVGDIDQACSLLRITAEELDFILKAGFSLTYHHRSVTNTHQGFQPQESTMSIVLADKVRNPSMTNTNMGHSDVDVTQNVLKLIQVIRDKGE